MLPQPHGRAESPRGEGRQRGGAEGGPGRGATLQALRQLLLALLLLGLGTLGSAADIGKSTCVYNYIE